MNTPRYRIKPSDRPFRRRPQLPRSFPAACWEEITYSIHNSDGDSGRFVSRMWGIVWNRKDAERLHRRYGSQLHWETLAAMTEEVAALASSRSRQEPGRDLNACEYGICRWPFLEELAHDAKTMTAGTFKRKHRVDVRDCRRARKCLRKLAAEGRAEDDEEVRKLAVFFLALWDRKMRS